MNKRKQERLDRNKKDKVWADLVKQRDGGCVTCGKKERLNAHHIIPRQNKEFRWNLYNGISLCPKHHRFSFEISAHQNPYEFMKWLLKNKMEQLMGLENE